MADMSLSDIAALNRDGDSWGNGFWLIALFLIVFGWNNNGFGNNAAAALGYENLATSNEVQRGFDNQNQMANQREILNAVTAGTAQSVATTNATFHDMLGVFNDKYSELQRDIATLGVGQANQLAKQQECCCETLRAIDGVNYNAAMNTNQIVQAIMADGAATRDMLQQNKIESLQNQINRLETQQALEPIQQRLNLIPTFPNGFVYSAGPNPFCSCNSGCCNI